MGAPIQLTIIDRDGQGIWSSGIGNYSLEYSTHSLAVGHDGTIFFTTMNIGPVWGLQGYLISLDPSGLENWRTPVNLENPYRREPSDLIALDEDGIMFLTTYAGWRTFDANGTQVAFGSSGQVGTNRWSSYSEARAMENDYYSVGSRLYMNYENRTTMIFEYYPTILTMPVIWNNETIYLIGISQSNRNTGRPFDTVVISLDLDGHRNWIHPISGGDGIKRQPFVTHDGGVIVNAGNVLLALDSNGSIDWELQHQGLSLGQLPDGDLVGYDGNEFFTIEEGTIGDRANLREGSPIGDRIVMGVDRMVIPVHDGVEVFGTSGGRLWNWSGGEPLDDPVLLDDGTVIILHQAGAWGDLWPLGPGPGSIIFVIACGVMGLVLLATIVGLVYLARLFP